MIHLHHHDRDIEDPWLRARLAMLPAGTRILDVGCVEGWVLDGYPTARGIDARLAPVKWVGRVDQCDAEMIPCPSAAFDAVTCVSVLEHVGLGWYGDPVEAGGDDGKAGRIIAEMARVLKPGGWLFLTVPLGLTMTKDGRPFARSVAVEEIDTWINAAELIAREWITVSSSTWEAAPDDRPEQARYLAIVSAQKPEAT